MSFGNNLANLRKRQGLSQEELGERLGVTRQTIYTWESDTSSPNMEKLVSIAGIFGCSIDELIRGDLSAEPEENAPACCKGDKEEISAFIKKFAFKIAFATFLILAGIAAMIFFEYNEAIALTVFFVPLIAAVATYIYAGVSHGAFFSREENKRYKTLYTPDEKAAELNRFGVALAFSVGAILIGVLLLCLLLLGNEDAVYPAAIFMAIVAAAVFFIIYYSIPLSKFGEEETLSEDEKRKRNLADRITSVLWILTVALYLGLGFFLDMWHPGWLVFVFSAFLTGIIETVIGVKKD